VTVDPGTGTDPDVRDSLTDPTTTTAVGRLAVPAFSDGPVPCTGRIDPVTNLPYPANAKCMDLSAGDGFVGMADGRELYMFSFRDVTGLDENSTPTLFDEGFLGAEFPAPTIHLDEGDEFYLKLVNVGMVIRPDLFDPHTVHYHGFPNAAPVYDGVPDNSVSVNMLGTLTYYYNNVHPGTYMYHCHVVATEHMQMGMLGNLYVRPAQNGTDHEYPPASGRIYNQFVYNDGDGSTGYDVEYPIQIGAFDGEFHQASQDVQPLPFALMRDTYPMINGRGYPDTVDPAPLAKSTQNGNKESQRLSALITATVGQRILLRVSNLNVTQFNTITTTLGVPMRVVGKDARLLRGPTGLDLAYDANSLTLGGGEAYDVILDTTDVAPGTYFLYTTNLQNLNNHNEELGGIMTEIVIEPAP